MFKSSCAFKRPSGCIGLHLQTQFAQPSCLRCDIPADQIKIEVWPIPGIHSRGGQHVETCSGVRVTHTPSGVQACVDIGRSQHINNIVAMDMILAGIRTRNFNNERRLDTRERE